MNTSGHRWIVGVLVAPAVVLCGGRGLYAQEPAQPVAPAVSATTAGAPVERADGAGDMTLDRALSLARERQPSLRQARAQKQVFEARHAQQRAPLLPQIDARASYEGRTANFTPRPGATPPNVMPDDPDFDLFNFFDLGITARQLVYDFGSTPKAARAARARADAQEDAERANLQTVEQEVRVAFFQAQAARALIDVARETLANHERHYAEIEAFVKAGARAEIDLAQTRTDRANARVDLIVAENAYVAGKARLNRAIGLEGDTDYDVAPQALPPVDGEDEDLNELYRRAVGQRPELAALQGEVRAQQLDVGSAKGGHWPALSVYTGLTDAGVKVDELVWNWNAGVSLAWPLFQGGAVSARVSEAKAALSSGNAQLEGLRQQVRLEVEQARLTLRAAKAVIDATEEALTSARDQVRLAEGRYQAGVGNALELGDAQLAFTAAAAQRVRADYELSTARANLLRAIGR